MKLARRLVAHVDFHTIHILPKVQRFPAMNAGPDRLLPFGAAHVLGRVGEITERQLESEAYAGIEQGVTVGQAGVEAEHNRLLMGKDGLRRVVVNSRGVEVAERLGIPGSKPWTTSKGSRCSA